MISLKIYIPEKVSSNAIYSGMHWTKRKRLADLYHNYFFLFRNKYKVSGYPVDIVYRFSFTRNALDTLNTAFMAKMCEDALVQHGILEDDSPKHVASSLLISKKGDDNILEIEINENPS